MTPSGRLEPFPQVIFLAWLRWFLAVLHLLLAVVAVGFFFVFFPLAVLILFSTRQLWPAVLKPRLHFDPLRLRSKECKIGSSSALSAPWPLYEHSQEGGLPGDREIAELALGQGVSLG